MARTLRAIERASGFSRSMCGKMCKHRIRSLARDRVSVEQTLYDLTKGRITFRHKDERAAPSGNRRPNYRR